MGKYQDRLGATALEERYIRWLFHQSLVWRGEQVKQQHTKIKGWTHQTSTVIHLSYGLNRLTNRKLLILSMWWLLLHSRRHRHSGRGCSNRRKSWLCTEIKIDSKYPAQYRRFAHQLPDFNQFSTVHLCLVRKPGNERVVLFKFEGWETWDAYIDNWERRQLETVWANWATWHEDMSKWDPQARWCVAFIKTRHHILRIWL